MSVKWMPVQEIKPCPYINGYSADNTGVSFMFEKYRDYSDLVTFKDGKPERCFRINNAPTALTKQLAGALRDCRAALDLLIDDYTEQEENPRLERLKSMIDSRKAMAKADQALSLPGVPDEGE